MTRSMKRRHETVVVTGFATTSLVGRSRARMPMMVISTPLIAAVLRY